MNYIANNFNHEVKTHKDYTDVSFYEDNSKITKVELDALIPVPNGDPSQGEITTPDRLYGYFGLNKLKFLVNLIYHLIMLLLKINFIKMVYKLIELYFFMILKLQYPIIKIRFYLE